jgi:bifunctional non-homologous end joining protein LigD
VSPKAASRLIPGTKQALEEYQAKRDFSVTPEPKGEPEADGEVGRRFVVQRHRARRLHYDFRLEVDGVLVSWAVPKGPTLDPSVRSLAVHVEDHPIEYRDFEGVIPGGQYGGGDVIVWDKGTWEPDPATGEPAEAIAKGEIHFDLYGEKLRGRFVLVRTRRDSSGRAQWLLLHKHDDYAQPGWNPEDHPRSAKSGRTNDEVAAAPDAMWRSDLPAEEAEVRLSGAGPAPAPAPAPAAKKQPRKRRSPWKAPTAAELKAIDALGDNGEWEFQDQTLKLTNLNKVLFPGRDGEDPVTKRELIRYYSTIAPVILPYLVDRPVNLHRFPNGVDRPGFWHKEVPSHAPKWLKRWHYDEADPTDTQWYHVIDSPPALAWMANYGAIELHPWTSRLPNVREPTWAYIDIDPGTETGFADVVLLARLFRTGLDHLGVFSMPKVTGKRGIHIYIPIAPGYRFSETREWVGKLSRAVGATVPDLVSWAWEKSGRQGLARLDYTQNAINKTLAAAYSVRPAAGAPVSVPMEWDELEDPDLQSDRWTIRSLPERIAKVGDPFSRLLEYEQRLPDL